MTRYKNIAAAAFSGVAVLMAPSLAVATLMTAPMPAQSVELPQFNQEVADLRGAFSGFRSQMQLADEAAMQFEQSYGFAATGADRGKACR